MIKNIGAAGTVVRQKADVEARQLYDIAIWQGVVGIGVVVSLLMQAVAAEEESEETKNSAKKRQ